jgi:hypothetical protein
MSGILQVNVQAVREIILAALSEAKRVQRSPKLQSSKFVEEIGKRLKKELCPASNDKSHLKVQTVNETGTGKIPGEWLLDAVIYEYFNEVDRRFPKSPVHFLKNIVWSVESESNTRLTEMAKDFNKLLAIKSDNYLYLNGVNQKTPEDRLKYMLHRLETAKRVIDRVAKESGLKSFYFAFWPSPERVRGQSLWDDNNVNLPDIVNVHQLA